MSPNFFLDKEERVGFFSLMALAFSFWGGTGMLMIGAGIGTGDGERELGL